MKARGKMKLVRHGHAGVAAGCDPQQYRRVLRVIVACVGWGLGSFPATAQDARAYQLASDLRQRGATVDDVVRELVATFRLAPAGVARVLRAERIDAATAGVSMAAAMRVAPATAFTALLDADYGAAAAAAGAARLAVDTRTVTSTLRARSVDAELVAAAVAAAFPRATRELAADLRHAEYPPRDVARGLHAVSRGAGEAFEAMVLADFNLAELRIAGQFLFLRTPQEYVAAMKAAGETAHDVALVLKNGYGLDALAGAQLLCEGRFAGEWRPYSPVSMTAALREVWLLAVVAAYGVLQDHPYMFASPWQILESGGYETVTPVVDGYRIGDYRPGQASLHIDDVGVINPARVHGTPDPWDGEVEILVRYRDLDGLVVLNNGGGVEVPGEILGREPVDYQAGGVMTPGERLRVRFHDIRSGSIGLVRTGRSSGMPVLALGHAAIDQDIVEGPLRALQIAIGSPKGSGSISIPNGTWGGVLTQGSTTDFTVPTSKEAGTAADVIDLHSNAVSVATTDIGAGMLDIDIEVSFEETGAEVAGTFLEYIPCWRCGTLEIPQSQCALVSINCFLGVLGSTLAALGTCLDPKNWIAGKMAAGPALPFEADLTSPRLTINTKIGAQDGQFRVHPMVAQLSAGISLRGGPANVPLGPLLQTYILGEVNQRLNQAIVDVDLAGTLQASLEMMRTGLFGSGAVRGLYLLTDGRWFIDLSY